MPRQNIAILGWGSLIWDPRGLQYRGRWYRNGPTLPIEFSRISRNGRLTLVIDEKNGAEIITRFAFSSLSTLESAINDLNKREGDPGIERIGFIEFTNNTFNAHSKATHPKAFARIAQWGKRRKMDAVIWTGLESNFEERRHKPFSPKEAVTYLEELEAAIEYVKKAPDEVVTKVRTLWKRSR